MYPAYEVLYGLPMTGIIGMYEAIMGSIAHVPTGNSLFNCLLVFNVPFTLFKGLLDVGICFLIYKPLSSVLSGDCVFLLCSGAGRGIIEHMIDFEEVCRHGRPGDFAL